MAFTLRNLGQDLEDIGFKFDGAADPGFRLATDALELEQAGPSLRHVPAGFYSRTELTARAAGRREAP